MNRSSLTTVAAVAVVTVGMLSACGSDHGGRPSNASSSTPSPTTPSSPASTYHVTIDPTNFTTKVDHPYYPLKPGTTKIYEGVRDGAPHRTELVVTKRTRVVMGVTCVVVEDTVTSNGALVEKTEDWYAQDKDGTVWYFGENTAEYVNGAVSSTHGTWEAGVDGAQPGVIMYAKPTIGREYYQEYRPGEAEDKAKILATDARIKVPAGRFTRVITTEDSDPLNPDTTDKKWYARGVGVVHSVRIKSDHHEEMSLTKVISP
jgi:hypothetical protein